MNFNINISFYLQRLIPILASILILLFTACQEKELDISPVTSISDKEAYSTPEKIEGQVNGLYTQLSSSVFYGGRVIVFNEQRGNEFSQNDGNNSTGANVWNQSISASGNFVNAVWNAAYTTINSANILIENLENSRVVDEALRRSYIGEAKFIRAFCYFTLVQTYAKPFNQDPNSPALPLRLKAEVSGGNNDLEFSTVSEIYTQIINDLDESEMALPVAYSNAVLNTSRARKATAIALKTRVYLTQSSFSKVIEEANKLVSASAPYLYTEGSITHRLESSIATVFSGSYVGNEAIFTIPFFIASEAPGQQAALAYNYLSPVLYLNSEGIVSDPVFASPTSNDARKQLILTNANGQKLLNKFKKNNAPFFDYIPLIRYAEVLLNYAEAAAKSNNLEKAFDLLETVRHRSDPSFTFST